MSRTASPVNPVLRYSAVLDGMNGSPGDYTLSGGSGHVLETHSEPGRLWPGFPSALKATFAANPTGPILTTPTFVPGVDISSYRTFALPLYLPDASVITALGAELRLRTDASNYFRIQNLHNTEAFDGWNLLYGHRNDPDWLAIGSPDAANITSAMFYTPKAGGVPLEVYFGPILMGGLRVPRVGFVFTEAFDVQPAEIAKLQALGWPGLCTFEDAALDTGGRMSTAQMQAVYDGGWQIGFHIGSLSTKSLQNAQDEFSAWHDTASAQGWIGPGQRLYGSWDNQDDAFTDARRLEFEEWLQEQGVVAMVLPFGRWNLIPDNHNRFAMSVRSFGMGTGEYSQDALAGHVRSAAHCGADVVLAGNALTGYAGANMDAWIGRLKHVCGQNGIRVADTHELLGVGLTREAA